MSDQRVSLEVKDVTLLRALSSLGIDQDVPIGLELALGEKYEHRISIDVNQVRLQEVLSLIVQQEPNYQWDIRDGVVNCFPSRQRDPLLEKFLNTRVAQFMAPKGLTKFRIRDAILDLPEVHDALGTLALRASRNDYPHRPSIYAKDLDLNLSNTDSHNSKQGDPRERA